MGRQFLVVSALVAFSIFLPHVSDAQGPSAPRHLRGGGRARGGPPVHNGRDRFFQLSPEERQRFQQNAERWLRMNPEQQRILREREQVRRQQLKREADTALRQSGLRLDQNARDQFEARYLQERRRIERELRQEIEARRQQQLPKLNERLKSEFQQNQGGTAAPVPSASARTPQ